MRATVSIGLVLLSCIGCGGEPHGARRILLATTTSAAQTGLLDSLLAAFTEETGIRVDYVAVGSGAALELGRRGDVDAILAHAPASEIAFVAEGYGLERIPILSNDFVIVGPPDDPARVAEASSAGDALRRIAASAAGFVSRGDDSGTHQKEFEIRERSGVPPGEAYIEAGQGMAGCLLMASEKGAYTLSDRATFLSYRDRLHLCVLFEGDRILENPYSVIAVRPERRPRGNHAGALRLIEWMSGPAGQSRIRTFKIAGEAIFHPLGVSATRGGTDESSAARRERDHARTRP